MFPSLDQAMAQFEGFGQSGTIATRQNNPGNIAYGPFAQLQGATGAGTNNIAIFPNTQAGMSAMDNLIQHYAAQGYNLGQLIGAWAPGNAPGNTPQSQQNYTNFVAGQTGASPQTPVSSLSQSSGSQCAWWDLTCHIATSAPVQAASNSSLNPVNNITKGFSFGRIAAISVGLISLAGAIYLFKPEAVNSVVRKGVAFA